MEDSSGIDTLMQEVNRELLEEFEKNLKIVGCLNELEQIIDSEFCKPIEITERDKFSVFDLIKIKLEYIKDSLLNEKSLNAICVKIFEFLFLYPDAINHSDLDEKLFAFNLILKTLKREAKFEEDNKQFVRKVLRQKPQWSKLIHSNFITLGELGIVIATVLKFSKTNEKIIEILLDILKIKHSSDFKILFDIKDIKDMDDAKIGQNFYELFMHETEYFYLIYENGKIKKIYTDPDQTLKEINAEDEKKSNFQTKDKEQKDNKKNDKKEGKDKGKKVDKSKAKKDDKDKKDAKKEEKGELELPKKEEENKALENIENAENINNEKNENGETKEKSLSSDIKNEINEIIDNDTSMRLNILENEVQKQKEEIEKLKEENKKQKEENNIQKKVNDKQKEENEKQNEEIENLKKEIKKKDDTNISNKKKMEKKIYSIKEQLGKVQTDLNLIKSRGAIKVFIEFFSRGFKIQEKYNEVKVNKILYQLNNYNYNQNNTEFINMLRHLLINSVKKLKLGNFDAHNIDKGKPILPQLFKIIDPEGNYKKVEEKLLTINADKIMMNSIINRENNYYNKDLLKDKDNDIYSKIDYEKFYSIFIN